MTKVTKCPIFVITILLSFLTCGVSSAESVTKIVGGTKYIIPIPLGFCPADDHVLGVMYLQLLKSAAEKSPEMPEPITTFYNCEIMEIVDNNPERFRRFEGKLPYGYVGRLRSPVAAGMTQSFFNKLLATEFARRSEADGMKKGREVTEDVLKDFNVTNIKLGEAKPYGELSRDENSFITGAVHRVKFGSEHAVISNVYSTILVGNRMFYYYLYDKFDNGKSLPGNIETLKDMSRILKEANSD